jgi:hypothetical protein
MFGPHRSRTELYGFQPGVRFNLDVQMPGTWTSMYCMKSRAKTSTYIPTDNNVQQHQLRKPEPPSLIHPVVHMTIAPLARPRSSALCALLYLFICNSYMPRGRPPRIDFDIWINCRRMLQHFIVARNVQNVVHLNPRTLRRHYLQAVRLRSNFSNE